VQEAASLTGLQLAVLDVLWEEGEATAHRVWTRVRIRRPLALTTVSTILARLERKSVLEHRREGRRHVYRARVSRRDVRSSKVRALTEALFDGDPVGLVEHLVDGGGIDPVRARRIRDLLDGVIERQARRAPDGKEGPTGGRAEAGRDIFPATARPPGTAAPRSDLRL
jgi:BlaI family penicillinase repressor